MQVDAAGHGRVSRQPRPALRLLCLPAATFTVAAESNKSDPACDRPRFDHSVAHPEHPVPCAVTPSRKVRQLYEMKANGRVFFKLSDPRRKFRTNQKIRVICFTHSSTNGVHVLQ